MIGNEKGEVKLTKYWLKTERSFKGAFSVNGFRARGILLQKQF